MKDISVDIFDPASVKRAMNLLNTYKDNIEQNFADVLEMLGKGAQNFAKPFFINYERRTEEDAVLGVDLDVFSDKPGFAITAVGKGVGFLEFGAGLTADPGHPFAKNAPFPVGTWTYSKDNARQGYENGYWYWGGKKWYYKPVHPMKPRGLYTTTCWIRTDGMDFVRRSWKK